VPFQFDDHNQISYRDWVHSLDYFKKLSIWLSINERPLSLFTIAINYVLHGEKVFGYHVVNFLIHFASGLALYYWLRILPIVKNDKTKSNWFPIVVALFFLLHPVQTQSVTYIIQRMTSLAGMFLLLSVFFYTKARLKHVETANFKSVSFQYILSLIFGVLGVLSKQNVAVFPVVLLLIEFFFIRNREGKIYKTYITSVVAIGFFAVVAALVTIGLPSETTSISSMQYFATQMLVIPRYFQMMLVPIGLSLDHGVKIVDGLFNTSSLLGLSFILLIIGYAIFMAKREPLFAFGIFWIFITLSVESSFLPITDPMFDHRMYLPVAGFGMAFWTLLNRFLFEKKPSLLKPVVISILLLFSVMTIARNHVWNSRVAIWTDVTEKYPDHLRGWMALGKMYLNEDVNDVRKATECFEKAQSIDPANEENLIDLGFVYMSTGQQQKGLLCYEKLQKSKNREYREQALRVMAAYQSTTGNIDDAETNIRKVLKIRPGDAETWKSLFYLYFNKSEFEKANRIAVEWNSKFPKSADAIFYVAKSLFQLKEKEEAEKYLKKALVADVNHAESMMLYANIWVNRFEYDKAIQLLEKAYSINKNSKIPENIEMIKQLKIKAPKPK